MTTPAHDAFLVEADALRALDAARRPLLIDARTPEAFAAGHLPGARFLTTYGVFAVDTTPAGLAAFREDVVARYAAIGVDAERPIVVYEQATGMRAAREAWILEWLGHPDVRILHGGLDAWRAAGGAITTEVEAPVPARFVPRMRDDGLIVADEIVAGLGAPGRTILDVRDATEFAGDDDTPCCARRGRLPGAVWLEWTELLDRGRFAEPAAVRERLAARGIRADDELVPYCHRGARSAAVYWALRRAGLPRVRNFIGSFHEWSARPALPVER
mgnify:CR=1 FL=1